MAAIGPQGTGLLGEDANWDKLNGISQIISGQGGPLSKLMGIAGTVATEPKMPAANPIANSAMPPLSMPASNPAMPPPNMPQTQGPIVGAAIPQNNLNALPSLPSLNQPPLNAFDKLQQDHPALAAWANNFNQQGQ